MESMNPEFFWFAMGVLLTLALVVVALGVLAWIAWDNKEEDEDWHFGQGGLKVDEEEVARLCEGKGGYDEEK